MAFPLALAIGAGVGLLKSELVDKKREKKQRELAAETQRLSPWTGLEAGPIQQADPLGSMLSFGMAGHGVGQGMEQAALNQQMVDKWHGHGGMATTAPAQATPAYGGTLAPNLYDDSYWRAPVLPGGGWG